MCAALRSLPLLAGLLLMGPALAGEKDKEKDKPPAAKVPATPREALVQALTGLADGDEARALAAIRTTKDEQKELLRAMMAFNRTGLDFRDAFLKAYGKAAWETFQDPAKAPEDGNTTLNLMIKAEILPRLNKAEVEVKGDSATARMPGDAKPTKLVMADGGWMLDFEANFLASGSFTGQDLAKTAKTLRALAATVQKYQKAIGAKYNGKDIGPEDIDAELGRAIVQVLTGQTTDTPHRFDIDKVK
jgi:hypothetical protein